jgi:hypothetical protein
MVHHVGPRIYASRSASMALAFDDALGPIVASSRKRSRLELQFDGSMRSCHAIETI